MLAVVDEHFIVGRRVLFVFLSLGCFVVRDWVLMAMVVIVVRIVVFVLLGHLGVRDRVVVWPGLLGSFVVGGVGGTDALRNTPRMVVAMVMMVAMAMMVARVICEIVSATGPTEHIYCTATPTGSVPPPVSSFPVGVEGAGPPRPNAGSTAK